MFKVFSKSGNQGVTALADGTKVAKISELIELYGGIDELNAFIGWCAEILLSGNYQEVEFRFLLKQLYSIQRQLFSLGQQVTVKKAIISDQQMLQLEKAIDAISDKLPTLKSFILPGGGEVSSRLHVARAVCRRIERVAFKAAEKNKNVEVVGAYLNRLSDWLFVAARFAAFVMNVEELTVAEK